MKKLPCIILWLTTLVAVPAYGQDTHQSTAQSPPATLTKFDLDFPGGTPDELVAAIQQAMGRPLNAIVPAQYAGLRIPVLKMKAVDVDQLFDALERASRTNSSQFSFYTRDGPRSDSSIWTLSYGGEPLHAVRFYSLNSYLDRGLTVDDITTAIQTAWKMLGHSSALELSFHKETGLLIAAGDGGQFQIIQDALKTLYVPTVVGPKTHPDKNAR